MEETIVQEPQVSEIQKKPRKPRQDIKGRVIPLLQSKSMTQSEISKELGVQQGAVFYTLKSLLKDGKVLEQREVRGEGKKDKVRYTLPS